jgi:hypothetical protein
MRSSSASLSNQQLARPLIRRSSCWRSSSAIASAIGVARSST